jgi:uncharacterized protein DUF4279
MERDNFIYKSHCQFGIISDTVSPDEISKLLEITPDKSFKKGEKSISKHSGSVVTKPHNLWSIKSKPSELEKETISHHIEYFISILSPKKKIINKYKEDFRFDVGFWIRIETDNSGIGFDISEKEMSFLNGYSNNIHFSFITNK